MKTNILLFVLLCASLGQAGTNEIPTFTISAQDVIQSSVHKYRFQIGTNKFGIKFQYTEAGSNQARAFTEAHQGQWVRDKIGEFETPPMLLLITNTSGRNGYHGISAKDANAIMEALKSNELHSR